VKVLYDRVGDKYKYPLSRKDLNFLQKYVGDGILQKIKLIRFGCNTKTTQEGRTVKKGNIFEIRINFCLYDTRSVLLVDDKKYIDEIKAFGGVVNFKDRFIEWDLADSKLYAYYILLHEIGHIKYCEEVLGGSIAHKASLNEENYCDKYSMEIVKELKNRMRLDIDL